MPVFALIAMSIEDEKDARQIVACINSVFNQTKSFLAN
jgi:hypothetical protein